MAVQSLKPRIDMMKARYGDDNDKVQRETKILYDQAGVNPLAGVCICGGVCCVVVGMINCGGKWW